MIKAKSSREFVTFAVMVYGSIVEYYIHQYHPSQSSSAVEVSAHLSSYTFKLIQKMHVTDVTKYKHSYDALLWILDLLQEIDGK